MIDDVLFGFKRFIESLQCLLLPCFQKYAIARYIHYLPIAGANATLNVWQPFVDHTGVFSLSQIWITSHGHWPAETIEVGWTVSVSSHHIQLFMDLI